MFSQVMQSIFFSSLLVLAYARLKTLKLYHYHLWRRQLKCTTYLGKLKQGRPSSFEVSHSWFIEDYIISPQ